MELANRLLSLGHELTAAERNNLRLLLGMAAGDLVLKTDSQASVEHAHGLRTVVHCLARLQPHGRRIPPEGILWRGRPAWMTDSLLEELNEEADHQRGEAILYERQFLSRGGERAHELAKSEELLSLAVDHAGPAYPTGVASYLYYDQPGLGIDAHVDTDVFALNAIIMLRHTSSGEPNSELIVYPVEREPLAVDLAPGELVLLFADSVVHERTGVAPGEVVDVLTIGFRPPGPSESFTL